MTQEEALARERNLIIYLETFDPLLVEVLLRSVENAITSSGFSGKVGFSATFLLPSGRPLNL